MDSEDKFALKDFRQALRTIIAEAENPWPARSAYVRFSNLRSASLMSPDDIRGMASSAEQKTVIELALRRLTPHP